MFCYARSERSEFKDRLWMTEVEISPQNLGNFSQRTRETREKGRSRVIYAFSRQTVKDEVSVRVVCCLVAEFMQKALLRLCLCS